MAGEKICVMITTYGRPLGIYQLTKKLKELNPDCVIVVLDDHTKRTINKEFIDFYIRNPYNYGKKKWYKSINILWWNALKTKSDYYIMMVDDSLPNKNFFKNAVGLFKGINNPHKIAMHLANNGRKRNWTDFDRVSHNRYVYLTQTTETSFICLPEFITYVIPIVPESRWKRNPNLGSGVFPLLNRYWVKRGRTIYGVKKSLIHANKNCTESKMNPEEREKNPWIIK